MFYGFVIFLVIAILFTNVILSQTSARYSKASLLDTHRHGGQGAPEATCPSCLQKAGHRQDFQLHRGRTPASQSHDFRQKRYENASESRFADRDIILRVRSYLGRCRGWLTLSAVFPGLLGVSKSKGTVPALWRGGHCSWECSPQHLAGGGQLGLATLRGSIWLATLQGSAHTFKTIF